MNLNITQTAQYFAENDKYAIICHSKPDGDTLGSAAALVLALTRLGKCAVMYCADVIPNRIMFLVENVEIASVLPDNDWQYVAVDIASEQVLRGFDSDVLANRPFDMAIDHHRVNTLKAHRKLVLSHYPATGQIIAEIIDELGISYDQALALPLYGAISSDSGCFKYSATLPQTHILAARLIQTGIDFAKINRMLFECKTRGQLIVEKYVYQNTEFYYDGKLAITIIPAEVLDDPLVEESDTESAVHIPRQVEGVEVSCVMYPREGKLKASLRSNDYFDVAALAAQFGGGGHLHAAGCYLPNDQEIAKRTIVEAISYQGSEISIGRRRTENRNRQTDDRSEEAICLANCD